MDSNKKYWKGLEELNQTPAFVQSSKGEFSESIPVEDVLNEEGLSTKTPRRDFLKVLGFGLGAVSLAACQTTPVHKAVPYLIKPEEITPGVPNYYASSFNGQSVLVRTREGRPILVEANPNSVGLVQGAESATVASVLDLYDMTNKLQNPQVGGRDVAWAKLDSKVIEALNNAVQAGKRVAIVSRTINSPTALATIAEFTNRYPGTIHVQLDPISYAGIRAANEASFGQAVVPTYKFEQALVVLSVGADFLGTWLDGEEHTQDYIKNRNYKSLEAGRMSRHIQFETGLSMTGTNADVRIAIKPSEEAAVLISLYNEITGSSLAGGIQQANAATAIKLAAQELLKNRGQALVVAGANDVHIQTLTNAINAALGAYGTTIDLANYSKKYQGSETEFASLLGMANAGQIGAAILWNSNPVYDYYDSAAVKQALSKIDFTVSFSDRADETASELKAIAPASTFLESWGDESAKVGYYTIVQPTINPVFNTRQAEVSLLTWAGNNTDIYTYVRNIWESQILTGSTKNWTDILQTGFEYKGNAAASSATFAGNASAAASAATSAAQALKAGDDFELALYQPANIRDGRYANNAYLQELPDPVSKVTWDNYVALNPKDAERLGFDEKSTATVKAGDLEVELPVLAQPGQALGTASVALGYGRTKVGKAGNRVGVNVFPFAQVNGGTVQFVNKVTVSKASRIYELAQTQTHHTIEGRNIIRETTFTKFLQNPASEAGKFSDDHKTYDLWNKFEQPGHKWVMAIDLNACTGCGSCIVACNVENNIPVVGRDEVRRRREMHWLRIDRYYTIEEDGKAYTKEDDIANLSSYENVSVVHQPMMCQHCEHAPCETVCPVLATVHSSEGLNHMAYNRCFGTRYCANNCPYKVRRFNWFNYWNDSRFDNYLNNEFTQLVLNPDVTTRSRGVMEKCSMCIQRIQAGKLHAKMEGRKVLDGEIQMACSSACSANAMIFGDANDPNSEVSKALRSERIYYVLEEINVQPNIGYMTKVRNTFEA